MFFNRIIPLTLLILEYCPLYLRLIKNRSTIAFNMKISNESLEERSSLDVTMSAHMPLFTLATAAVGASSNEEAPFFASSLHQPRLPLLPSLKHS